MSSGIRLYLSRDRHIRASDNPQIQVWLSNPSKTKFEKSVLYTDGDWLASIPIKTAEKMGKEFVIRPGTCKPVMMHTL